MTNDSQAPETDLIVTGKINPIIAVSPKRVKIIAHQGDNNLAQEISIKPVKERLFTIKRVTANREDVKGIRWNLEPKGKDIPPKEGYLLTVTCDDKEAGRSANLLLLETDLQLLRTVRIPVSCNIFALPSKKEKKAD